MAWNSIDLMGAEIATVDASRKFTLGQCCKARDTSTGYEGEFIYMQGVASNATGLWNQLNYDDHVVSLLADGAIGGVGVSMGATIASTFGWFQTKGKATAMVAAAVADNAGLYISAAGVAIASASGKSEIIGARTAEAADSSSAGNITCEIHNPVCGLSAAA